MRRPILAAAAFLTGIAGGCFLKPVPNPGFRFSCESDADCLARNCKGSLIPMAAAEGLIEGCDSEDVVADGTLGVGYRQTCIAGLCEFPCTFATVSDACPPSSGFNFCFNGRCANVCGTEALDKYGFDSTDDYCTAPERCVPIEEGSIEPALFSGQGSTINVNTLPDGAGFCGTRCDENDAPPCPAGEYCAGALCLPGCDNPEATPCADGTTCFAYGDLSACLTVCGDDVPCPEGLVCVPGVNICQPTCLGEDGVNCDDGFTCDDTLGVCIPTDLGGTSESTG